MNNKTYEICTFCKQEKEIRVYFGFEQSPYCGDCAKKGNFYCKSENKAFAEEILRAMGIGKRKRR